VKTPLSPKVTSGATWATLVTLALQAITPDMLTPLGKYQGLAEAALAIIAFVVGSYLKEDTLRTAGAKALADAAKEDAASPSVEGPAVDPVAVAKAIPAVANVLAQAVESAPVVAQPLETPAA
jgi:hypothetical protein